MTERNRIVVCLSLNRLEENGYSIRGYSVIDVQFERDNFYAWNQLFLVETFQ